MTSRELRQKRAGIVAAAKLITDQPVMTAEDGVKFDAMYAEVDALEADIKRIERAEASAIEMSAKREVVAHQNGVSVNEQIHNDVIQAATDKRLLRAYLARAEGGLSAEDRVTYAARISNALSTSPNTAGGYTIPPAFQAELLEVQKAFGGVREVAQVIKTERGNTMNWPTVDDTNNVATIIGENLPAGNAPEPLWGSVAIGAWMYRSGFIKISYELLQDSAFDLEAYIRKALATRFARGQNAHMTTGAGTAGPQGVITGAALGKVGAAGQTNSITYDDLIDMEHSIDPAYRVGRLAYMMHDTSVKYFRKMKDANGRPLFWDTSETLAGSPTIATLNGKPVIINQDMPVMAPGAKSILYGNFDNYLIRDVMDLVIRRVDELFVDNAQVGFLGFQRMDARLISAGQPIRYYQNAAA